MANVPLVYLLAWPFIVGAFFIEMIKPGSVSKPAERWVDRQEREAFNGSDLYRDR